MAALPRLRPRRQVKRESSSDSSASSEQVAEKKTKAESESSSDSSASPGTIGKKVKNVFNAADASAAKAELLRCFVTLHTNGRVRCINSRANYVYCKCSACGATAAVSQSKKSANKWILSSMSATARLPCSGFIIRPSMSVALSSPVPPPPPSPPPPVQSPPTAQCCICADDFQRDVLFECPNPAAHLMCQECFEMNLSGQFGQDLQAFISRNCEVICTFCACQGVIAGHYNMQALVPR
jgi:hypothetical protein